ncbi:beta-lactamase/transpeptidase-like protein [Schizophyllum commune]
MLRPLLVSLVVSAASGALLPSAKEGTPSYVNLAGRVLDSSVDKFVIDTISEWNSPGGVAVAFVQQLENGEWQVETQGYGRAKADGGAVDEDTLFAIASNSKLFTAISAGLLISNDSLETPLTWETKLKSIIPEWKMADHFASAETTITDAMSHRTGLPRHDFGYSKNETLSSLEHIFDPLGLNDTTYSSRAAIKSGRLADPLTRQVNYTGDIFGKGTPRVYPFFIDTDEEGGFNSGAGGVISSAKDMATWLQALLLEGRNPRTNESVIPADVIRKVASGITVDTGAAIYRGYRTQIIRFPNEKFGLAVLVNDDTYGTQMHEIVKWRIVDAHLGLQPIDWSGRAKSRLLKAREEKPKLLPRPENATLPSGLDGWYDNPGYGRFLFCSMGTKDADSAQDTYTQMNFAGNNAQAFPQNKRPKDALAPASAEASACSKLRESADVLLPGVVDPSVPTLLARWDRVWSTHIKLAHYDGGIFNVTILDSVPTGNASEPYWVGGTDEDPDLANAEFAFDLLGQPLGFGLTGGLWGAGAGVPSPSGSTPQERAEACQRSPLVFPLRQQLTVSEKVRPAISAAFGRSPSKSASNLHDTIYHHHEAIPYPVRQDAGAFAAVCPLSLGSLFTSAARL